MVPFGEYVPDFLIDGRSDKSLQRKLEPNGLCLDLFVSCFYERLPD